MTLCYLTCETNEQRDRLTAHVGSAGGRTRAWATRERGKHARIGQAARRPGRIAAPAGPAQPERLGLSVALQRQQEREGGADQRVPARAPDQPVRHAVHAPCEFHGPAVVLADLHQRREVLVGEDVLDHRATPVAAVGGVRVGSLAGDVAVSAPSQSRQDLVGRSAAVVAARGPGRRAG